MNYSFGIAFEAVNDFLKTCSASEYYPMKKFLQQDLQIATEGFSSNRVVSGAQSKFVNHLMTDLNAKAARVDFGDIPDSKGNIAKWKAYKNVAGMIDTINKICGDHFDENIVRMNSLNKFLVAQRADFEYGYKTNNSLIMITYQCSAMALMDISLVNLCTLTVVLENINRGYVLKPRTVIKYKQLSKSIDGILNLYKSGDWAKLMRGYKNMRVNANPKTGMSMESAALVVSTISTIALIGVISAIALVALISAIRGLITLYYTGLVSLDQKCRSMEEYLKEIAPYETDTNALAKQEKAMQKLNGIAGFIEVKLLKDDQKATQEITRVDSQVDMTTLENMDNNPYSYADPDSSPVQYF